MMCIWGLIRAERSFLAREHYYARLWNGHGGTGVFGTAARSSSCTPAGTWRLEGVSRVYIHRGCTPGYTPTSTYFSAFSETGFSILIQETGFSKTYKETGFRKGIGKPVSGKEYRNRFQERSTETGFSKRRRKPFQLKENGNRFQYSVFSIRFPVF